MRRIGTAKRDYWSGVIRGLLRFVAVVGFESGGFSMGMGMGVPRGDAGTREWDVQMQWRTGCMQSALALPMISWENTERGYCLFLNPSRVTRLFPLFSSSQRPPAPIICGNFVFLFRTPHLAFSCLHLHPATVSVTWTLSRHHTCWRIFNTYLGSLHDVRPCRQGHSVFLLVTCFCGQETQLRPMQPSAYHLHPNVQSRLTCEETNHQSAQIVSFVRQARPARHSRDIAKIHTFSPSIAVRIRDGRNGKKPRMNSHHIRRSQFHPMPRSCSQCLRTGLILAANPRQGLVRVADMALLFTQPTFHWA